MGKTALLFPGQGSQWPGMGRDVAEISPAAAGVFASASEVMGFDLSELCFQGPADRLEGTDIQQPAIFVTGVAIYHALQEKGWSDGTIQAAAGLSLGEYTALHVAGAMTFEDGIRLVYRRGQLMKEAGERYRGGMVSVMGADPQSIQEICERARCGGVLSAANFNCPGQIVLSGDLESCARAVREAEAAGFRAVPLKVSGAFHSALMQDAADGLAKVLESTVLQRPQLSVLANVNASPHGEPAAIRSTLQRQLTQPVQWQRCIERLIQEGFDTFIEIGPGRVLTGLMRKIDRKVKAINISTAEDVMAAATASTTSPA